MPISLSLMVESLTYRSQPPERVTHKVLRGEDLGLPLLPYKANASIPIYLKFLYGISRQKRKSYFTPGLLGIVKTISQNLFHVHDATNAVALLHLFEGCVDGRQRLTVGDELIHLELAVQVVVHETGQLSAALNTTKSTSLPHTTGNQLEGYTTELVRGKRDKGRVSNLRRVEISWPAAATPMMMLSPQPLWQASRAARITPTLPVQSKV